MKLYSQRDARWKNEPLGFSTTTTIGSHGCTITCIAMLADLTPSEVNQRLKSVNGYALKNLVIWSKINEAIPWLEFEWRSYTYNNDKVSQAIEDNGGCLVEVDFDGTPRTSDRHWVLFTGSQKMSDPWTGTVEPTNTYPLLEGYSIIKVKENMGELPPNYEDIIFQSTQHGETVKYIWGDDKDPTKTESKEVQQYIAGLKSQATTLRNDLAKAEAEVKNREEQVSRLKVQLANCSNEKKELTTALNKINAELNGLRESCEADKEVLREELDECNKAKGELLTALAVMEAELNECKKGNTTGCWETFINNVKKLFERN